MDYLDFSKRLQDNDNTLTPEEFNQYIDANPYDDDFRFLYIAFLKSKLQQTGDTSHNFDFLKNAIISLIYKDHISVKVLVSGFFMCIGDYESALVIIDKVISDYGDDPYNLYLKGYDLMELKRYSESVEIFEKSLLLDDNSRCRSALDYSISMLALENKI